MINAGRGKFNAPGNTYAREHIHRHKALTVAAGEGARL
jgi:hypothetical protein